MDKFIWKVTATVCQCSLNCDGGEFVHRENKTIYFENPDGAVRYVSCCSPLYYMENVRIWRLTISDVKELKHKVGRVTENVEQTKIIDCWE